MIDKKLANIELSSPDRCQGSNANGQQCLYRKEAGSDYCYRHGAMKTEQSNKKNAAQMYRLIKYQGRVEEFSGHDEVKNLRAEIGILRMTLEELLNQVTSPVQFAIHAGRISDICIKLEKLVSSCHRIEISTGQMLDKAKVLQLGAGIVEIVGRHITDPEILDTIGTDVMLLFAQENL